MLATEQKSFEIGIVELMLVINRNWDQRTCLQQTDVNVNRDDLTTHPTAESAVGRS